MPTPLYQYVINLVVRQVYLYLWMFRCGKIVVVINYIFDVAKFTILAPLLLLPWCKLSFQIVGLKISSFPNFTLKPTNRMFILSLGNDWKLAPFPHKNSLSKLFSPSFKTMILHQRPLRTIYDTLSLTNSTLLTADTILWCAKILFPIDDFHFLFHWKRI